MTDLDFNGDGVVDQQRTETLTYAVSGNLLTHVVSTATGTGIVVQVSTTANTYDAQGHLIAVAFDGKTYYGGSWILRSVATTNTYDAVGRLLESIEVFDDGSDGVIDRRRATRNRYDARGSQIEKALEIDYYPAGGIVQQRTATVNEYDDAARLTATSTEYEYDAVITSRVSTVNSYDAGGRLVETYSDTDRGGDGAIERRVRTVNTYAWSDRPLVWLVSISVDDPFGGTVESRSQVDYAYDAHGNTLSTAQMLDTEQLSEDFSMTSTYDLHDKLLTQLTTSHSDPGRRALRRVSG